MGNFYSYKQHYRAKNHKNRKSQCIVNDARGFRYSKQIIYHAKKTNKSYTIVFEEFIFELLIMGKTSKLEI